MSLKKTMYLAFICGILLSAGSFALLAVGYITYFKTWVTLGLLFSVIGMVICWGWYYLTRAKYKESIAVNAKKRYGKGNRKNRRRKKR